MLSCNTQGDFNPASILSVNDMLKRGLGMQISEETQQKIMRNQIIMPNIQTSGVVVESLGRPVWFAGNYQNEKTVVLTYINKGEFVGLDDLALSKSIKVC